MTCSLVSLSSDYFVFELIAFLTSVHAIVLHNLAAFHFLSLLLLLSFLGGVLNVFLYCAPFQHLAVSFMAGCIMLPYFNSVV